MRGEAINLSSTGEKKKSIVNSAGMNKGSLSRSKARKDSFKKFEESKK